MNKNKKEHEFVGAGIFTYCKNCGKSLLSLGIPQKPCIPQKRKKLKKESKENK